MVAVHEKNGNTQGFQTPEPVAQGELGGDAGVLLIVHVASEEQEIQALALAQIEEAAKRGERGCAQAFREIGGDVPGQAGKRGVQMEIRGMLQFDGVVITDDLMMSGVSAGYDLDEAAVQAVKAGNDMLLSTNYQEQIKAVIQAVKDGEIDEAQIDAAVARVLKWKNQLGFEIF